MKKIVLTQQTNERLTNLYIKLKENIALTIHEKIYLAYFIENFFGDEEDFPEAVLNVPIELNIMDVSKHGELFDKWIKRFGDLLPGEVMYGYYGLFENDFGIEDALIEINFQPSKIDNENQAAFPLYLKSDGRAVFRFHELEDAHRFPELDDFQGSWEDAYFTLANVVRKHWPKEDFPKPVQTFLDEI